MKLIPGRVVFYDGSDNGGPLLTRDLPDQRAVLVDIPAGAVSVVVVAPVWTPPRRKISGRIAGLRRKISGWRSR